MRIRQNEAEYSRSSVGLATVREYRSRFIITIISSIPALVLLPTTASMVGVSIPGFLYKDLIAFALVSFIFLYGGWPFLRGWITEFRVLQPGRMTLLALALIIAYAYSVVVYIGTAEGTWLLPEIVILVNILLLAYWITSGTVRLAFRTVNRPLSKMPEHVQRKITGGATEEVPTGELVSGDVVVIHAGEVIPVDGDIIHGKTSIDESLLTGVRTPVSKKKGDQVTGGTINTDKTITVKTTAAGDDRYLHRGTQITHGCEEYPAVNGGVTRWITVAVIAAAVLALGFWQYVIDASSAHVLRIVISILVIAHPYAREIAIPTIASVIGARALRIGILVRNRLALERIREADVVVFDKTGILTYGAFKVAQVKVINKEYDRQTILDMAASAEVHSEHPTASAITEAGKPRDVRRFEAMPGRGVLAQVYDDTVVVANRAYCKEAGKKIPAEAGRLEAAGNVVSFVIINGGLAGLIALRDEPRNTSAPTVAALKARDVRVIMLSGDSEPVTRKIAEELGIDEYRADVMPDAKADVVAAFRTDSSGVVMVGNGVNDASVLTAADIGIALGTGTALKADSADILVVDTDPAVLGVVNEFSHAFDRKVRQNVLWAHIYTLISVPFAAGAALPLGVLLTPGTAALMSSGSRIVTAFNSFVVQMGSSFSSGHQTNNDIMK